MTDNRPRVVFDCQVFLQAVLNRQGPAARCLALAEAEVVELCVSQAVLREVADVLSRPELRRRFRSLDALVVGEFIQRVCAFGSLYEPVPEVFPYERDPKDEPYLNLVIAARANFLVSRDRDLLDLQSDSSTDGQRLRRLVPGLVILDPVAFLQSLASQVNP